MPKSRRPKPLYQRGEFFLPPAAAGRKLEIYWYDASRGRERRISTGTADIEAAKRELDRRFVEKHGGIPCCPTCGRPLDQSGEPAASLIANYLDSIEGRASAKAIRHRLNHILDFMEATGRTLVSCTAVDEDWVQAFRTWAAKRPITSPQGKERARAPSTIENSVIQLAAAFRHGGVAPAFKPIPTKDINRTPHYRADMETLAAMFRYCVAPTSPTPAMRERHMRERAQLLNYLRAAVATWARPDAIMDIGTQATRRQWFAQARVLALNPDGRRQTRKYRATIPVAEAFAAHLDACDGPFITVASVKSAWEAMAQALGLPGEGQSGLKLIRRSVAHIARKRMGEEHWLQGQIMLGHHKESTSDIYALPDPANLGRALAVTSDIIAELDALTPGAFTPALPQPKASLRLVKSAK